MGTLGDFLNPKVGGRKRREWLDGKSNDFGNLLQYYAGPGVQVENLATIGDALNPVSDIQRAGQNAQLVAKGDMGAMVPMVTDMASVLAPGAAAKYAGGKATNAVVESLLGVGQPTRKGLQKAGNEFVKSEDSGVALDFLKMSNKTGAQTEAQTVLDMLKSGRGADVTDDMMSKADDAYLFDNYDLPMDEASRMARAKEAGFGDDLYHGTNRDFDAFGSMPWGGQTPNIANEYAAATAWNGETGQRVLPIRMSGKSPLDADRMPKTVTIGDFVTEAMDQSPTIGRGDFNNEMATSRIGNLRRGAREEESGPNYNRHDFWNNDQSMFGTHGKLSKNALIDQLGFDSVKMIEMGEPTTGVFDAAKARSKFARFDPRLKNLSNLSASVAGGGLTIGAALRGQDDDERTRQTLK
jgi:hypothetical protein